MNTEVQTTKKNLPVQHEEVWGTEDLDASDIVIPRLLLMQGQSEFVNQGKAVVGEMVNSLTGEKVCPKGKTVELVLVDSFKNWAILRREKGKQKFDFDRVVPVSQADPKWKTREGWEETFKDGTTEKRAEQIHFYVLDASKLSGPCLPMLLTFRVKNYQAGKKIATFAHLAKSSGKPIGHWLIRLGAKTETNDSGTFFVFTVEQGREASAKELEKAKQWYSTIRNKGVEVAPEADQVTRDEDVSL